MINFYTLKKRKQSNNIINKKLIVYNVFFNNLINFNEVIELLNVIQIHH